MSFYSVEETCQNEIIINKSRFITTLYPILDFDDAITKAHEIAKRYSDATHNCIAFISKDDATESKFRDDGEPQGTAGLPMLEVLKKRRVYKTLAVTTRYFGGIKLGEGGLINAYTRSVSECLDKSKLLYNCEAIRFKCYCEYKFLAKIVELLMKKAEFINQDFTEGVCIECKVAKKIYEKLCEELTNITQGKCIIKLIEEKILNFSKMYEEKIK